MSNSFGELFELELKCWCYGLAKTEEAVGINVLHKVIREFSPVLKEAIENHYICDIVSITKTLLRASRCKISEKELCHYILSHLPMPSELKQSDFNYLYETVEKVDQYHPGATSRLEKKWNAEAWQAPVEYQMSELLLPLPEAATK